jgi:hypothetical protein
VYNKIIKELQGGVYKLFIKENINPLGKKTTDCVIRAIAKAEGKEWLEVFDILVKLARENYTIPNGKDNYKEYLEKYPKINVFHMVANKKKRYTVKEVSKWQGTYIVQTARHLTTTIDGNYYDTWDSGNKCAYVIHKVR